MRGPNREFGTSEYTIAKINKGRNLCRVRQILMEIANLLHFEARVDDPLSRLEGRRDSALSTFDNERTRPNVIGMALRRLGPDPHKGGAQTPALNGCPDIFELETGDFAIVGQDITSKIIKQLPPGATCGPDERIVVIPRKTLVLARPDIPKKL